MEQLLSSLVFLIIVVSKTTHQEMLVLGDLIPRQMNQISTAGPQGGGVVGWLKLVSL